jgi:hypothetical protein
MGAGGRAAQPGHLLLLDLNKKPKLKIEGTSQILKTKIKIVILSSRLLSKNIKMRIYRAGR